ncbi:MAG: hypothetical protein C0481_04750 [Phenylobacterium sp.]|uniref:hypothetical protein n=1 Tax=Phenylobacterium sp. TaxID=1871053 RepID=UPI0025E896A2|nr:hypothetical protein [Phenylobacterium sp.]MBA4011156.1 hypothetical protein [Phenylobacterium sp.]
MRTIFRALGPLAACLALAACATVTSAPAGAMKVGDAYEVALGREWSDISNIMNGRTKKVRLLSIDGPLLNRLYLSDGLEPGEYLIKPAAKETPTPVIRKDMSASERLEFVADSVVALEYQRVQLVRPRPAKLGQGNGVRFDLTAQTKSGLDVKGTGVISEQGGKTYVLLYLAPAEHYFDANLAEVEAILGSARLG